MTAKIRPVLKIAAARAGERNRLQGFDVVDLEGKVVGFLPIAHVTDEITEQAAATRQRVFAISVSYPVLSAARAFGIPLDIAYQWASQLQSDPEHRPPETWLKVGGQNGCFAKYPLFVQFHNAITAEMRRNGTLRI